MPTIYDNIEIPFLTNPEGTGLREALQASTRGDFCVGYFNLRGWRSIDDVVQSWPQTETAPCRLLVGMHRVPNEDLLLLHAMGEASTLERLDNKRAAQLKRKMAQEFRKQLTIGVPTPKDEAGLRRLQRQMREGRLHVKLFLRHPLHAKLYLAHRDDKFNPVLAFLGSSNLTMSGLKGQGELNIDVADRDASGKLVKWFEDRWEDPYCLDITTDLIDIIEESWAGERLLEPYHVYLKMAWHLSRDARDGIQEFRVPHDISDDLLSFQVKAVQLACRHLNKRGGVLVGDVVGLGKTRVVVATDVLSEGQNLQDCARVVNYDLPWAIIRLIQRAGRVDRIGQKAEQIYCYSFLPAEGVEKIIRLRQRLLNRLHENEEVVGSDESFFENQSAGDEEGLRNLYNEKSGALDDPEDDEVDLTSEAYEIWARALKADPDLRTKIEALPDVVYATKAHRPDPDHPDFTPPGALVYIRTRHDNDALVWMDPERTAVSESPVRILRAAIQAVYDHPLTTQAVDKLNRQLRSGIEDDELAQLVTTLHQDDRLVIAGAPDEHPHIARILCSMGLKQTNTKIL